MSLGREKPGYEPENKGFKFEGSDINRFICRNLDRDWNDKTESYKVVDGCCAFYKHYGCRDFLFQANNRGDVGLRPGHIRAISAFRCADDCHDWWSP
ncbi:Similar to hypothetical protein [Podospora anserina S mat+]; acc. no. XP_001903708 [Pyronema omphalodes CBS 100304]|uniref:Uncharacterized protein n=1 Tax=Pyronema omphalodes (strain CBS 100304) TaxID=1076935 RepID=U4L2V0_PYROM|nr:Similar to hypothetical protein [Podospora anserina S mat+]; acc. no. XP_001903708 [Pyronema omphalodes CBS 100304]